MKESVELIGIKNIDLSGISIAEELRKLNEEQIELQDSFYELLSIPTESNKEHFAEELCDQFQASLSLAKLMGIDIKYIANHWNTKHKEKLRSRPRKK